MSETSMTIPGILDEALSLVRLLRELRAERPLELRLLRVLEQAAAVAGVVRCWEAYAPRQGDLACVMVARKPSRG